MDILGERKSHDWLGSGKGNYAHSRFHFATMKDTGALAPITLALTESVATYMTLYFNKMIHCSSQVVPIPKEWDIMMLHECHQALAILQRAYDNQSKKINWSKRNNDSYHFQNKLHGLSLIMTTHCPQIRLAETSKLKPRWPNDFLLSMICQNSLRSLVQYLIKKATFYCGIYLEP